MKNLAQPSAFIHWSELSECNLAQPQDARHAASNLIKIRVADLPQLLLNSAFVNIANLLRSRFRAAACRGHINQQRKSHQRRAAGQWDNHDSFAPKVHLITRQNDTGSGFSDFCTNSGVQGNPIDMASVDGLIHLPVCEPTRLNLRSPTPGFRVPIRG